MLVKRQLISTTTFQNLNSPARSHSTNYRVLQAINYDFTIITLTVFSMGILERALYCPCLMMVTVNVAFIPGSSKQGKAERALVGSKYEAAKYLKYNHLTPIGDPVADNRGGGREKNEMREVYDYLSFGL